MYQHHRWVIWLRIFLVLGPYITVGYFLWRFAWFWAALWALPAFFVLVPAFAMGLGVALHNWRLRETGVGRYRSRSGDLW